MLSIRGGGGGNFKKIFKPEIHTQNLVLVTGGWGGEGIGTCAPPINPVCPPRLNLPDMIFTHLGRFIRLNSHQSTEFLSLCIITKVGRLPLVEGQFILDYGINVFTTIIKNKLRKDYLYYKSKYNTTYSYCFLCFQIYVELYNSKFS